MRFLSDGQVAVVSGDRVNIEGALPGGGDARPHPDNAPLSSRYVIAVAFKQDIYPPVISPCCRTHLPQIGLASTYCALAREGYRRIGSAGSPFQRYTEMRPGPSARWGLFQATPMLQR